MNREERLKNAPCGYLVLDYNSYVIEVNDTFLAQLGFTRQEAEGKHIEWFLKPVNRMLFHSYFYPTINLEKEINEFFIKLKNKDGIEAPYLMSARQFEENEKVIIDCVLLPMNKRLDYELELRNTKIQMEQAYLEKESALTKLGDIYQEIENKQQELLKVNEQLVNLSNTDQLTGIPNRRLFEMKMKEQIVRYSANEKITFCLFMIDIDHFKKINDQYGHLIGDSVLIKIAQMIQELIPVEGMVARYGGEEFIVILPYLKEEKMFEVAQKINESIEKANWVKIDGVTVSVGVSDFQTGDTRDTIVERADLALYKAKRNGRNQVVHSSN
ncbi:MAG: sensor domain-containing diguanylate cyclase [Carnobacterium sp.]|uniref:sensor domain-containing diguanylate cyclase n=1 Tax=Carnobacterium sp. TaxID=48221 RepID=UPI003C75E3BC